MSTRQETKKVELPREQETKPEIKNVHFINEAVLNFQPANQASSLTYDFLLTNFFLHLKSKNDGQEYIVPLTNVKTIVFERV